MLIELQDVAKVYRSRVPVQALHGVNLTLNRGELVVVTGPSGSGKSTLLHLLAGLDHPTAGRVCVNGQNLSDLGPDALATFRGRTIGVVFQFFQLLPTLSILENVMLAMDFVGVVPRSERAARATELLAMLGVEDQSKKLPTELSGGQQQRVAMARALANDPEILLADEPTGNLDQASASQTLAVFDTLKELGKTVVIVTHAPNPGVNADRRVTIADGLVSCA